MHSLPDFHVIKVKELCHRYASRLAVDHLSFQIKAGTIFGLIGPNGAGKSTTIKMLTTLLPITSGLAQVNGFDVSLQPQKVRQTIGYVPQQLSANGELTGYENLLLSAKLYGLLKPERTERIEEVLHFMQLYAFKVQLVSSYSGGMARTLEIGQALLHRPPLLFLDEPTVGLDPFARKTIWRYLKKLNEQKGMAILITTHDMEEAEALCDQLALFHNGQIVAMDSPSNLTAKAGSKATLDDVFILHTGNSLKEGQF